MTASLFLSLVGCSRAPSGPTDAAADAAVDAASDALDAGPTANATVVVDPRVASTPLDSTFAGLSYEKSTLPTPLFSGSNAALIGLFRRLGPSVLRVGGNSVDKTTWNAAGAGLTAGTIAPADVDRLAAFLRAADWKVIYGVNLASSTATAAADEAAYAAGALGDRLLGFEIGNEPDLYSHNGDRPTTYVYSDFRSEWESYASAIRGRVAGAPLTGPASASHYQTWTVPFAHDESTRIFLLTQHWYLANGQDPGSTIDKLLAPNPTLPTELSALAAAASAAGLAGGYRLAEANSYYNGGAPNVSDSYASALWVIQFLFAVAQGGASGVNLHGGGNGPGYTPIANDSKGNVIGPRPEYDGVLLFSLAAGGHLVAAQATGPISAWAVDAADGSTAVVLVNVDATTTVHATIDLGAPKSGAQLTTLTGPSLASTTGVLLDGTPVAVDGGWTPAPTAAPVAGSTVVVDVAPASAVLVRAR